MSSQELSPEEMLETLMAAEAYWIALAMKTQGSRFFRALGDALDAADARNRAKLYAAWPTEIYGFYLRGQRLEAGEPAPPFG